MKRGSLVRLTRIIVGFAVVAIPAHYLVAPSSPVPVAHAIFILALLSGLIMGSLWSIGLVLVALFLATGIWRDVECIRCPPGTEPPGAVTIVLTALATLIPITGAALGTALWKLFERIRPWLQRRIRDGSTEPGATGRNTTSSQ